MAVRRRAPRFMAASANGAAPLRSSVTERSRFVELPRNDIHGWVMLQRFVLSGSFVVLGLAATAIGAAAQALPGLAVTTAIGDAGALSARIRGYHQGPGAWSGSTPPPGSYCPTMREGEAVMKELGRLANQAIFYGLPDVALRLPRAGDLLRDARAAEEDINRQAAIPYNTVYPCPARPGPYLARAFVLRIVVQAMPNCRRKADVLRVSFQARRALMQQCLRIPGS